MHLVSLIQNLVNFRQEMCPCISKYEPDLGFLFYSQSGLFGGLFSFRIVWMDNLRWWWGKTDVWDSCRTSRLFMTWRSYNFDFMKKIAKIDIALIDQKWVHALVNTRFLFLFSKWDLWWAFFFPHSMDGWLTPAMGKTDAQDSCRMRGLFVTWRS